MVHAFHRVNLPGRYQDPNSKKPRYQRLHRDCVDRWRELLANPLRKAWCRHYLNWIGPDRLALMGYSRTQLITELDALEGSRKYLLSDMVRMPGGKLYAFFEGRMLFHKLRAMQQG